MDDYLGDNSSRGLWLFECCCCRSSKHEPIMLRCLHYYCQSCHKSSGSPTTVKCPVCSEVTELTVIMINSFLSTYKRASALRSETVWCNACDAEEITAEFWCVDCCKALCETCYSSHNKFTRRHRSAELEIARYWSLGQLTTTSQCSLHERHIETQCFTCSEPKCVHCYERCRAGRHDLLPLSHDSVRKHVIQVTDVIRSTTEFLSRHLSGLRNKCQAITYRLQAVRISGHKMLVRHRQRLHTSTVIVYDKSVGEVCVYLQKSWREHPDIIIIRAVSQSCAATIEALCVGNARSMQILGGRHSHKTNADRCTVSGRVSVSTLRNGRKLSNSISIDGSVPLTSYDMLAACLGAVDRRRAAPHAPQLFGHVSVIFRTTFGWADLAVTREGHVLLAALTHGLLVYSSRGQQLSSWRPTKRSDRWEDWVRSVAALNDGRAAVGMYWAQLVVLLRCNPTGDTWLEDRHVTVLQSPPLHLAAQGDLLAAVETRRDDEQDWVPGRHAQLVRLSSGQMLYRQCREYDILSIALTALCVITTSLGLVKCNGGLRPIVDAFSHSGEFLWRHEACDDEVVRGLCAAETWSRVYFTVMRRDDLSSSRVMAIGAADGSDVRDVMSSRTRGQQLPGQLSLARVRHRAILAVLSWDGTLTLYDSTEE